MDHLCSAMLHCEFAIVLIVCWCVHFVHIASWYCITNRIESVSIKFQLLQIIFYAVLILCVV